MTAIANLRAHPDGHVPTLKLAWRVATYRVGPCAGTLAMLVVSNGLLLVLGLLLQRVFDGLTSRAPAGLGVYGPIAILVAVEFTRIGAAWGSGMLWTACYEQMGGLLRVNLLRAQMQSGGPEAGTLHASPGEAVSRFRDDIQDVLYFLDTALWVAGRALFALGSVTVMLRIDPLVTVAVALPLAAMVVAARVLTGRIRTHRRASRQATAAVAGFLGEVFGAVLAIKTAAAVDAVLEHLAGLNERRRRAALRDQLLTDLLDAFNSTTVDLSIGLVLLLAASALRRGDFTVGDLALFASYAGTLVDVPRYGGQLLVRYRQAGVAVERLTPLLPQGSPAALVTSRPLFLSGEAPPVAAPVRDGRRDALEVLEVRGLSAVHPTSGRGVHDLSLALRRGTLTVVTGPVGAGKTTLLRALLGLLPAQAGTVSWNGAPVADPAAFLVPPRAAYVPQVPRLFSESLQDNLLLGLDRDDAGELTAALRTAVLEDDVAAMPDGLATRVGARGIRLSGGQVQRSATARALVRGADLLVLDDVSSALDVETERRLWDRLLADRSTTYLVVSNRPATIARADQVVRLDHGRVRP
jgi:ATP-binding cassette, subfamily B, bacterial